MTDTNRPDGVRSADASPSAGNPTTGDSQLGAEEAGQPEPPSRSLGEVESPLGAIKEGGTWANLAASSEVSAEALGWKVSLDQPLPVDTSSSRVPDGGPATPAPGHPAPALGAPTLGTATSGAPTLGAATSGAPSLGKAALPSEPDAAATPPASTGAASKFSPGWQPTPAQPSFPQAGRGQPLYGQPVYGQAGYFQGAHGQAGYAQPGYRPQQGLGSAPGYGNPQAGQPVPGPDGPRAAGPPPDRYAQAWGRQPTAAPAMGPQSAVPMGPRPAQPVPTQPTQAMSMPQPVHPQPARSGQPQMQFGPSGHPGAPQPSWASPEIPDVPQPAQAGARPAAGQTFAGYPPAGYVPGRPPAGYVPANPPAGYVLGGPPSANYVPAGQLPPRKKVPGWAVALIVVGVLALMGIIILIIVSLSGGGRESRAEIDRELILHPELEELYRDCDAGSMRACDDLYWESPFGSALEQFGDTCGGTGSGLGGCTVEPFDDLFGGLDDSLDDLMDGLLDDLLDDMYDELFDSDGWGSGTSGNSEFDFAAIEEELEASPELRPIYEACAEGDMSACDDLYVETSYWDELNKFGDGCGGKEAEGVWCDAENG